MHICLVYYCLTTMEHTIHEMVCSYIITIGHIGHEMVCTYAYNMYCCHIARFERISHEWLSLIKSESHMCCLDFLNYL